MNKGKEMPEKNDQRAHHRGLPKPQGQSYIIYGFTNIQLSYYKATKRKV